MRNGTLLVVALTLSVALAHAQDNKPTESQVRAAYLYNFGKFVEWPPAVRAAKGEPFAICVFGQDPFGPALDSTLAGESIGGATVVARRISKPAEMSHCRIVFIAAAEEPQLKDLLAALDKNSVLTVSDMPEFTRRGGMLQFVLDGKRVRFEVNLAAAERAGLTLSSQLLKLAVAVRRN